MEIFALKFIFWLCIVSLAQVYVLYPYSLKIIRYFWSRSAINRVPTLNTPALPTVSAIIAAHNEESVIEEKILNTLALN
jgi:cellulose synthase/poly-beta-1,6-N-acetylglucosamine synthase-like glycosyltransferase